MNRLTGIAARLGALVSRGFGLRQAPSVHRFNVRTDAEAARWLAATVAAYREGGLTTVLVIGDEGAYRQLVIAALGKIDVKTEVVDPEHLEQTYASATAPGIAAIALATLNSKAQFDIARKVLEMPALAEIPLEYVALPHIENAALSTWDVHASDDFVSPMLCREGSKWFDVYRDALRFFELKTDIRDYLDLAQALRSVTDRRITGNVAEFGSFRGHSGYLISRLLEEMRSDKTLFMFDTFETFPEEAAGIDRFWSRTHDVDFADVKHKFEGRSNVVLVKGDFTRTLVETETGPLSLVFVDCDSYRATKFLLNKLWDERLVTGGLIVLEDYGHGPLLGNRLAVHEFFDDRSDAYAYFSQFSGLFIALKTSPFPSQMGSGTLAQ